MSDELSNGEPRFLGVDDAGDRVWELPDGRWTWGEDAADAAGQARTFEPARYAEKYGSPTAQGETRTIEELVAELGEPEERITRIVYYLRRAHGDEAVITSRSQADPIGVHEPERGNPIVVTLTDRAVEAVRATVAAQIPASMARMD